MTFLSPFCGFASLELSRVQRTPPIGGYYGGKASLRKQILKYFPSLPPTTTVLGDINPGTIELLKEIRDRPEQLIEKLKNFQWKPEAFAWAKGETSALATIAFSAMAHHRGGSRSGYSSQQAARAAKRNWNYLRVVSDRLQAMKIVCQPWQQTLATANEKAFVYLDPPYLSGGEHYQFTLNQDEHYELINWCLNTRAKIALSGYADPIYDRQLSDWRRITIAAQNNHRQSREEILWLNWRTP